MWGRVKRRIKTVHHPYHHWTSEGPRFPFLVWGSIWAEWIVSVIVLRFLSFDFKRRKPFSFMTYVWEYRRSYLNFILSEKPQVSGTWGTTVSEMEWVVVLWFSYCPWVTLLTVSLLTYVLTYVHFTSQKVSITLGWVSISRGTTLLYVINSCTCIFRVWRLKSELHT